MSTQQRPLQDIDRAWCARALRAALLLAAFLPAPAAASEEARLTVQLRLPDRVESGGSIPLSVALIKTAANLPVDVPRPQGPWTDLLRFAREALQLERLGGAQDERVALQPLPRMAPPEEGLVSLGNGATTTYTIQLRRVFDLGASDEGRYRVTLIWSGATAATTFEITPGNEVTPIAAFDSACSDLLYLDEGLQTEPVRIEVVAANAGGHTVLRGRTTYRYGKGAVLLASGGEELRHAQGAVAARRGRSGGAGARGERSRSDSPLCEYVGVAWLDHGKLTYTSYGIRLAGHRPMASSAGDQQAEEGPDYSQLAAPRVLPLARHAAAIASVRADAGLIEIAYQDQGGQTRTIRVDEQGEVR